MNSSKEDLCRLCAKNELPCKNILDSDNHHIHKLCHELVHVTIIKNDGLSTKVCHLCEEKMVSFNFFIEECKRVQELFTSKPTYHLPEEKTDNDELAAPVKYEVKEEFAADGIEMDNEGFSDINTAEYENDDLLEDITIASLKKIKAKSKIMESKKIKRVNGKLRALFSMLCEICSEPVKNWSTLEAHYSNAHSGIQPVQHCVCGYASFSQSALYKHYKEHKQKDGEGKESKIKITELVQFICKVCNASRRNWTSLESHYRRNHKVPCEVECSCGMAVKSRSMLYKHIQAHNNQSELYSCDSCPKISKTKGALLRHMELKHGTPSNKEMQCAVCEKVFTNKELLKSHVKSHIPVEERKCHKCLCCNLKFTTRSSMLSHKKVVHDKLKSYVCDQCGYACGTNGELKQHRAIHSDEKPFVCSKCSKRFKTYSNLKTHMDTHEDTSYACYICARVLNSRRTLRKHLLVHQTECRHVCSYCNKAFKRRQTLKVHLSTHTGDKPMSCKWCDEKFAYASTLRSHRLRFHPDKVAVGAPAQPYTASAAAVAADFTHTYEVSIYTPDGGTEKAILKIPTDNEHAASAWKVNPL